MQQQIMGLVVPAMALLFSALFLFLWRRDRDADHIKGFATSYALLALGSVIFHYSPDPDGMASVLVMHLVYSGAVTSLCWALYHRIGVQLKWSSAVGICAVTAVAVAATTFAPSHLPRIFAVSTCYGLIFALAAQTLSRAGPRELTDRIVLGMIILTSSQFFLRPYITFIMEEGLITSVYRDSAFYSVTVVVVAVISLMLALSLVAMCVVDQIHAIRAELREDSLSGLLTRRAFELEGFDMLKNALESQRSVCIIVADIDHFKRVNDIWGHQTGDSAIAAFGAMLKEKVRLGDQVGRIGGEEFCVLVRDCELDPARGLAERIRRSFSELHFDGMPDGAHLTASFGIAQWKHGESYAQLFRRADAALYAAKDGGRDRVEIASDEAVATLRPADLPLASQNAA